MASLIFLTGALVVTLGIWIFLDPEKITLLMEWAKQPQRLRRIGIFRIALAAGFYFGAEQTRMPQVTVVLAGITFLAGLAALLIPASLLVRWIDWWLERANLFTTPLMLIELTFGLFLMWLAWPMPA